MPRFTRRRFLTISAGLAALPALPVRASTLYQWQGVALGARAQILLDHPDAGAIAEAAAAEIARLEAVFSLFRADSALSQLNASGSLSAPPFELLQCLALCEQVHAATAGLFDPTVQPLWALYATSHAAGRAPTQAEIDQTLPRVGWPGVTYDDSAVRLRPGMSLTLNGVAQGFIAYRVAGLLAEQGLTNILVNTGEFRALGTMPDGQPWPVSLTTGGTLPLVDRSLASSSALGTTFDAAGQVGHILNPGTGLPALPRWKLVTITAPSAGLADALSTAACLMPDRATIETSLAPFAGAALSALG